MEAEKYLSYLQKEIHSAVFATVDNLGNPVTCVIDIMFADKEGLYFLTAKGKAFYFRLKANNSVSITGFHGADTMTSKSISICGKVKEIGNELIPFLFEKNPYMNEIYPTKKQQEALTVFQLYQGNGEWFDLSKRPIERENFSFGGVDKINDGYFISDKCNGCKQCYSFCPQKCIEFMEQTATIKQEHCLHCGNCFKNCPVGAVVKRS